MTLVMESTLIRLCAVADLEVERGRAALLDAWQIALFRLADGSIHAVDNFDPFSGANVISRGIVGTRGFASTVASPLYKQVFDLATGRCLDSQGKRPVDGADAALRVWPVRIIDGDVFVEVAR
ncbi:nitrite reductase (NAD(P)H) small subunit [Microbacterium bovistercoris]|uniref:Nitrite reductase (NAD(P)H) small subunit n=1 Tax=Microbacterium bovistercoris TaxID=2293570 RepID=A0A371NT30_9MICO|nr:nitrite reductase small subunit NirD [Microbacterium bovistercoris]REJ05454.1 nitrite reductase (NAD(P)H) small subunit [Microbacterium bovistercoris]